MEGHAEQRHHNGRYERKHRNGGYRMVACNVRYRTETPQWTMRNRSVLMQNAKQKWKHQRARRKRNIAMKDTECKLCCENYRIIMKTSQWKMWHHISLKFAGVTEVQKMFPRRAVRGQMEHCFCCCLFLLSFICLAKWQHSKLVVYSLKNKNKHTSNRIVNRFNLMGHEKPLCEFSAEDAFFRKELWFMSLWSRRPVTR